jgi:hypothetical protein
LRLLGPEGVRVAHEVFISYASPDAATAAAVCESLEGDGIACRLSPRDVEAKLYGGRRVIVVKAKLFAPQSP